MNLTILFFVALGGALGAITRLLITTGIDQFSSTYFPYATLFINVIGSFALGLFAEFLNNGWSPSEEMKLFVIVGLLGAFTTFSTFSQEVVSMIGKGEIYFAGFYILLSVTLSIFGLFLGIILSRQLFS